MATLLGEAKIRVRPDASGFESETKSSVMGTLGRLGKVAAIAFAGGAATAGGFGLKIAADMEQANIAFETMLGSGEKAQKFLGQLQTFAAKTPFEFPELQTAASSLVSVGINADKVIPIMTSLGNATSGMGTGAEGVKRATVALQQMNAAGRITGEDLNQLRDAGIPVFDLLAAATGKSVEEVAALAQAGKLGKKELEQLMSALESGKGLERFSGLMDKQSQSLAGLVSSAKDAFGMGLAKAMEPLLPTLKKGLEKVTPLVQGALSGISDKIGAGIAAAPAILQKLQPILEPLKAAFVNMLQVAKDLGPALGLVFGGGVLALLKAFAPLIEDVTGFLADNKEIVLVLVGAWAAYRIGTQLAAGAQLLLNAAMKANPIGLVVTALTALAAGAVWAWNNIDGFREVVTNAWTKVQEGAAWMWNNVLKPTFDALVVGWDAVVTGISWAWTNILKPTWDVLASVLTTLWNSVLSPIFGLIGSVFGALLEGMAWYWNNVLAPVFSVWWSTVSFLWQNVLSPIFSAIGSAWKGLMEGMGWVWDNILKPVFDTFGSVVSGLQGTFETVVKGIGAAWDTLKSIVAAPIKWVIQYVWNDGLLWAWNKINNLWDGDDVDPVDISKLSFASGGIMPGYTPGRDVHRFYSPTAGIMEVSGGEAWMRPEFTKAIGPEGVYALNDAARTGGASAVAEVLAGMGQRQAFADGGLIKIPDALKWAVPNSLEEKIEGFLNSPFMKIAGGIVGQLGKEFWKLLDFKVDMESVSNPEDLNANARVLGLDNPTVVQGSLGNSWAGIWTAVKAAIPQARQNSTYRNTPDRHGMGKAIDFGYGDGPGGAGSIGLASINRFLYDNYKSQLYELIYDGLYDDRPDLKKGAPLTYNAATRAQHQNHVHAAVYDSGGVLKPGLTMAYNGTGRDEYIRTADQERALGGALVGNLTLQVGDSARGRDVMDELVWTLNRIKRGGVLV